MAVTGEEERRLNERKRNNHQHTPLSFFSSQTQSFSSFFFCCFFLFPPFIHTPKKTKQQTGDGKLFAWGMNYEGQLGTQDNEDKHVPTPVKGLEGIKIISMDCGSFHSIALSGVICETMEHDSSFLHSFPLLSFPFLIHSLSPLFFLSPFFFFHVPCSLTFVFGLFLKTEDKRLFAWGLNKCGQLGNGSNENSNTPLEVESLRGINITRIACGWQHNMSLTGKCFPFFASLPLPSPFNPLCFLTSLFFLISVLLSFSLWM